ncbi:hypothetical protein [Curtobacterium luteum]|uniref:hypothetical protein n=1 Tax=Curtobacterium luteum TaxID=33881 RepID=UPI0037F9935E
MLRSRITAAAVGATALGVAAVLVPTGSTALSSVAAASTIVTWTDSASDFRAAPTTGSIPLTDQWYWADLADLGSGGTITDHATLDEDGLSVSEGEAVGLIRGLTEPVRPDGLGALAAGLDLTTTGATSFGLAVQAGDSGDQSVVFATDEPVSGDGTGVIDGTTNWIDPTSGEVETTTELAADLRDADAEVVGYLLYVGIDVAAESSAPPVATPDETPAPTPTVDGASAPSASAPSASAPSASAPSDLPGAGLQSLAAPLEANGQALAADASGSVSALRVDDTTTYFTPQPAATVEAPSDTRVSQTLTGFQVTGTGFAPYESVTATITQGGETYAVRTNASVADQDGDVVIVVVLPEGVASAGAYTATLLGLSSGQTASADGSFVADAATDPGTAPVAVPVSGTATFTG